MSYNTGELQTLRSVSETLQFLTFGCLHCRRALKMMLLGLLDRDLLAQAARKEDAGQVHGPSHSFDGLSSPH